MEKKKNICKRCNNEVSNDLKLCPYCGYKLSKKEIINIDSSRRIKENKIIKNVKESISEIDKDRKVDILIISVFVLVIVVIILSANNTYLKNKQNSNNENVTSVPESTKEVLEITNNDNYKNKMTSIMEKAVIDNKYFVFQGGYTHAPYLEYTYYSYKKYDKETIKEQAKIVGQKIMKELQNYEYKKGSIFIMSFEYINLHFYGYDDFGNPSRGDGVWIQFDVTKINSQTIDDVKVQ